MLCQTDWLYRNDKYVVLVSMSFYYAARLFGYAVPDSVCEAGIVKMRYVKNLCDS